MKRLRLHRIIPTAIMAAATAIPIATSVEILAHVSAEQATTTATIAAAAPAIPTTSTLASNATATQPVATSVPAATSTTAAQPAATQAPTTSIPAAAQATSTAVPATATPSTQTYVGPVEYDRFGAVQATITVSGGKITAVAISAPDDNPRSANINEQAIPILQSETLQAQSANIDIVSGATYTSEAYAQSLQAAIDQAHLS